MPSAVHRSIEGIINIAAETGRIDAIYDFTTRQAQRLLYIIQILHIELLQRVQQLRNN